MIKIIFEGNSIENCNSVIIVPVKAIEEHGYIQTLTAKNDASSKHEFHAMAQMAYFQFQDDELEITTITDEIIVESGDSRDVLQSGLVLCRDLAGAFYVVMHEGLSGQKLLEAANRFCTRWVRIDI